MSVFEPFLPSPPSPVTVHRCDARPVSIAIITKPLLPPFPLTTKRRTTPAEIQDETSTCLMLLATDVVVAYRKEMRDVMVEMPL